MKDLRIIFMGTPSFAVGILKGLVEAGHTIVGVITAPDKPAGRGQKLRPSAVKEYAASHGLPILQPNNLKDPEFLKSLKELKGNLQVVVAFRMLPEVVWELPAYGTFNLHASLLPAYRGAAPINWAIINKEKETGVTTFFIDEKIDTGAIIFSKSIKIADGETAGSLHDKLMVLGKELVLETVELIEQGNVHPTSQPKGESFKSAPKLHSENTRIDWQKSIEDIDALVRGLCPYPSAWTELHQNGDQIKVKIEKVRIEPAKTEEANGQIITTKKTIKVAAPDGYVYVEELKLAGKRKMKASELLNGFIFKDKAHFV